MNLVFMGNPAFAVPALEKLVASDYQIVAVVSNPPQKMGRGKKIRETEIAIKAKSIGVMMHAPIRPSRVFPGLVFANNCVLPNFFPTK